MSKEIEDVDAALELGSVMKTAVSELGLRREHGASAKQTDCGWMLSFYCQTGRVEMLICHDRSVMVKRNGQPALQAPDVSMAVIYLKELLAEEKKTASVDELALEIQSHLANDTGHLIRQLGLKPGEYSLEIDRSGLKLKYRNVEAIVCCDGRVKVTVNGERIPDALDVKMAISNLEGLSEQHPKRQIEEVQEEEPKKSPKIEEEEPVPPTQLVNLE